MEHESDEVKFEHHKRLIQITVGAAFAGCNLVEKSVDDGVAFRVRDFGIGAMYSLEVARPVLVGSRADGEIEDALPQAIRLMQENPGRVVMLSSPGSVISSWLKGDGGNL